MPVPDNQNSLTVGPQGPILLQDTHLIEKLAHFDRERIPERVVHAKGAGAHGYFECTVDMSKYTKAKLYGKVGKRTPLFARFSTVGGEKGSADAARDPRGFAVKHYTEEGVYDMVGNNTPIFFIRDPIKFPDFIHTQKRNPETNIPDANMVWDFASLVPESIHQFLFVFSDRGTPKNYRHMDGFSSHTYKWVNAKGEAFWIKLHYKTEAGIQNLTRDQAIKLAGEDADHATRDLFDHIAAGQVAAWKVYAQIVPFAEAKNYAWNIFDITKVIPHKDYPLQELGRMVLNRNPKNYFAEVEQAAFSPANLVPGIEPSLDRMLQGRMFSYPDTHRHRLGPNFMQIPINRPYNCAVSNYSRDGAMAVNGNGGSAPNYEPNSYTGVPKASMEHEIHRFAVNDLVGHFSYNHPNDDFAQPRELWRRVLSAQDKANLVGNLAASMGSTRKDIMTRAIGLLAKVDNDLANRVQETIMKKKSSM